MHKPIDNNRESRDLAETVLNRSDLLEERDRALLNQVLGRGVKPHEIAAISGVSTRTVQRQVKTLVDRLLDREVLFVMRHCRYWSRPLATVAVMVWVRSWSQRQTADTMGVSLHAVRQYVQAVRVLMREEADRAKRPTDDAGVWHEELELEMAV